MLNGQNLSENWRIILADSPKKRLRRIPAKDSERISQAIDEMAVNPFTGDIQKIGGEENAWRRRIGNYRILFDVLFVERIVHINDIDRRTSKTY